MSVTQYRRLSRIRRRTTASFAFSVLPVPVKFA
jgi:hypothetical protein